MNDPENLFQRFAVWFNNQHTWGTWCCLGSVGLVALLAYVVIRTRPKE